MKSCEAFVSSESDYYNYLPSVIATKTFFYPICTGHFIYEPGYQQHRNSYDSFLLMYLQSGELTVNLDNTSITVASNHFILLDCYEPHGYQTSTGCECLWCHFDGPTARSYYQLIINHFGNIFSMHDPYPILNKLMKIYNTFATNSAIREAFLSKQISDILTAMILYTPLVPHQSEDSYSIDDLVSYINEHFDEDLMIEDLAKQSMLSPYHFIRIFKKETGFTPHEYLIHTRISTAKYLLKTTKLSVKDICFRTGFSSVSVFCTSFKKNVGMTPNQYRNHVI
ncbi:transcriptional regulator, AraC family [Lachnospiraceae bacterium KM106-2]|nr:transcriptional regulator, AraC family [Lachnospiraceae bacterium KM106-2]